MISTPLPGLAALFLVFQAAPSCAPVAAQALSPPPADCAPDRVLADVTGGPVSVSVEIADSPAGRAQGLMGRTELAPLSGMLFVYEQPQSAWFWMKDTALPLDMVFIDPAGVVRDIVANATPFDETPVGGAPGIIAVLEIGGGEAERLGITQGTRIAHPALQKGPALWRCAP